MPLDETYSDQILNEPDDEDEAPDSLNEAFMGDDAETPPQELSPGASDFEAEPAQQAHSSAAKEEHEQCCVDVPCTGTLCEQSKTVARARKEVDTMMVEVQELLKIAKQCRQGTINVDRPNLEPP